jgi:hypothetical protein
MMQKGLRRIIASTLLGVSGILSCNAEAGNPADGKVDKYAVVVIGDSRGEKGAALEDPIDKNCFWLSGVGVYNKLLKLGFNHENIYFLYDDGYPDFAEEKYQETIKFIKDNEFNEPREDKKATEANLEKIINRLSAEVDEDDIFVFSLGTHGTFNLVSMEDGVMFAHELDRVLEKIEPGIGLACIDSCMSGSYINKIELDNYVIVSATDHNIAWADRNYSHDRVFFQNLLEPENDTNADGKVSFIEAHNATDREAKEYRDVIIPWIKEHYKGDRSETFRITFNPQIKIGKKASGNDSICDLPMQKSDE